MILDSRFYLSNGPMPGGHLFSDAEIVGDKALMVASANALDAARAGDLAYCDARLRAPTTTQAGVVVTSSANAPLISGAGALVVTPFPRAVFAKALSRLVSERPFQTGGPTVSAEAEIEIGAVIAPGAVIGPGAKIGAGAQIGPNAVIGPGVAIGRRSKIGAGASVRCALIGDDVTILPNAVIGEAGFAIAPGAEGAVDVPHIGRVIIQDGVTLGACVAVDRGLFADTVIAEGAKIDNLSHIAHNVIVGRNVVMAAFAGVSGSSTIGDGAMFGGRVGIADHLTIGARAQIAAGSAVLTDVPARAIWGGYPAKALRRFLREQAWLGRAAGRKLEDKDVGE
jgi:UDP-3-O-[3-hydroxymyristoyl] glucosamine N-acyltransferase